MSVAKPIAERVSSFQASLYSDVTHSSGYEGDTDQLHKRSSGAVVINNSTCRPPLFIQAKKRNGCDLSEIQPSSEDDHSLSISQQKRHKQTTEAAYIASTALEFLKKNGRTMPLISSSSNVRPSRLLLPLDEPNMPKVTLITSNDYLKIENSLPWNLNYLSPEMYTGSFNQGNGSHPSPLVSILNDSGGFYQTLLQSGSHISTEDETTQSEYSQLTHEELLKRSVEHEKEESVESASNQSDWCTSSMTGDNEECNNGGVDKATADDAGLTQIYIRMGDALGHSNLPRIIVLSFHPFTIVHVNDRFTEIMGLDSVEILGKPLFSLILGYPLIAPALQGMKDEKFDLSHLDGQAIQMNLAGQSESSDCTFRVRSIGINDDENARLRTHYLLEIVQVGDRSLEDEVKVDVQAKLINSGKNNDAHLPSLSTAKGVNVMG